MFRSSWLRQIVFFLFLIFFIGFLPAAESSIDLSESEMKWIQDHGPIRVSNELNWAPFNFNDRGLPAGYSIDCINLIAEILDIEINIVSGPTWNEFLGMLEREELDVILNIAKTPQRSETMLFTSPYSQFSLALFTRTGSTYVDGIQSMYGKTFAIPEGFWMEEWLADYPEIDILIVANTEEAIQAVSSGRADGLYDVMPVVQYISKRLFITNLQIGGDLVTGNNERVNLHMAVRKDEAILQGILDKGISAISSADFADLRNRWLSPEEDVQELEQDHSAELGFPIIAVLAAIVFTGVLLILLRRIITKVRVLNFRSIWIISIISLSIFIIVVVMFGWISINRIDRNMREDLIFTMDVILEATDQALVVWIDNNLGMIKRDAGNTNLRILAEKIINPEIEIETSRRTFQEYIEGSLLWLDEEMYQIIGPDSRIWASNDAGLEGTTSSISVHEKEILHRAFLGETLFVPPLLSIDSEGNTVPLIFFLSPIRDNTGRVMAVLARSDNPSKDFSRLVRIGHSGRSGETYAFDIQGRMISQSRFESQMVRSGLLSPKQTSILNLGIRDPGVNIVENTTLSIDVEKLELTYMASQAITGVGGQSLDGYRDYRGIPVFGVWHWDTRHGFGIVTEIDIEEGLEPFYIIRNSTVIILTATVLLAVLITLVSLIFSEKSNQSLSESRAHLEERVKGRTQELSQANKNLNNTIEALTHPFYVIDVKTHKIILANQAALKSGEGGASTCYSLTHSRDIPCDSTEHRCPMVDVVKSKRPVQVEHIHEDNGGNTHYAEVHGYPILDENNEVVQMIEYSLDITDRKNAEEMTRRNLQELELFSTLTVGREEKMIELKTEINGLFRQLNLPEKYTIVTDDEKSSDALMGVDTNE